ncbi:MAG TPA: O-antigen ligase family protein [Terriglobales bacterium]|nr:O-antigen ligase family protein [Terriglobales bacterium]
MYASLALNRRTTAGVVGTVGGVALVTVAAQSSPLAALGAVGGLGLCAILVLFPWLAVLLTAAMIPLERIGRLTADSSMYTMSLMRIVGVLALAVFVLHAAVTKQKIHLGAPFYQYLTFCVWAIATVPFSSDLTGGVRACSAILGNLLFFFLIVNMARSWRMTKAVVATWLCACCLIGAFTIYEWHTGRSSISEHMVGATSTRFSTVLRDTSEWESLERVDRALGTTSSPAVHAINMILTVPFFFFFFRTEKDWRIRGLCVAGCLINIYNIVLTNTRAALIVLAGVLLLCALRKFFVLRPGAVVSIAALVGIVLFFSPEATYRRVLDITQYSYHESGTLRTRMAYWNAGTEIITQNWISGVGLGNQHEVPAHANIEGPDESTVHNEYLETMIETGAVGWLIFFGFVGLLLRCSFVAASRLRKAADDAKYWFVVACQIGMIAVLAFAVQVDVFHFPLKGWWLIAGLTWVTYESSRQSAADPSKA